MGSPPQRLRSPYCNWTRPQITPPPCPRSAYFDLHASLCYCDGYLSTLGTSPVTSPHLTHRPPEAGPLTSPPLAHRPPETGPLTSHPGTHRPPETGPLTSPPLTHGTPETDPMIASPLTHRPPGTGPLTSSPLTHGRLETDVFISPPHTHGPQGPCPTVSPPLPHRPQGIGLIISPPLAHRSVETRPMVSPPLSHRHLETGPMIFSHWSSGRSYNDPPLSAVPPPPTVSFYHGCLKPPDSCEPKPQLDLPLGKNYCGFSPPFQADVSRSPNPPQKGSYHCSHLPPEAHIPAPGSPYCAIRMLPGSTSSPCPPQSQTPRKTCFESVLSWEAGGSSYLFLPPGTTISGPSCPQESPLSLSSHYPYSVLPFPSPPTNQFISPLQPLPRRSYNEPPPTTPISPQVKSPKSSELKQSRAPHRCHSVVIPFQCTPPGEPRPPKTCTSPLPLSDPSSLSSPSCREPSVTTPSNSCPKELPLETALPIVVPRTLKTVIPTSLPLHFTCATASLNSYAQSIPRGPPIKSPCGTHMCSVVPSSPHPCSLGSLSHSTGPFQCHNQPVVSHCGTYSTPRGPPPPPRQSVESPCATHVYSFIPLRTPFDPQSLPIAPRAQGRPDIPCGLHIYSVAARDSRKDRPQVPYSCPLPSSKSSSCSTNISCSSTVVISGSQSSDTQSKSTNRSRSRSQSKSPHRSRSRSRSKSPHQSITEGQIESFHLSRSLDQSKSPHYSRNEGQSKGLHRSRSQSRSKSPNQSINLDQGEIPHRNRSRSRSKSPNEGESQGRRKSLPVNRSQSKSPHQSESPHHSKSQGRSKSPRQRKK
ncbi:sperm head and tail associated protein-like [Loxodonta africana]|uniref:sperm head and tail associated protein-like n=1 Tax=Loxodonta africana TaxID=9785 RepID=UPI0030CF0093